VARVTLELCNVTSFGHLGISSEGGSNTSDSLEDFVRIWKEFAGRISHCRQSGFLDRQGDDFIVPVNNNECVRALVVLSAMAAENGIFVDLSRKFTVAFEL
jgi:hypothetical protein